MRHVAFVYMLSYRVFLIKKYRNNAAAKNSDTEKLSIMPYMPNPHGKARRYVAGTPITT